MVAHDDPADQEKDLPLQYSQSAGAGGTDEDVKARIQKARNAFLIMKNIWISRNFRLQTKLPLSNVRSVLYSSEYGDQIRTL